MYHSEEQELITVVIPIYNVERYLSECMESILRQTYKNIEILLIDDGSEDTSPYICDAYAKKDKRIRVIHQNHGGISCVRNLGVSEAKGQYIFWIDSDDYVAAEIIEDLYSNIVKYDADMSICNYTQGSDRKYSFGQKWIEKKISFGKEEGLKFLYESHHFSFIMAASWAKLIKKSLYKDLKYPVGKIFEDIYMSHHLIHNCDKIVYTDKIMYYYYQWPESILGKKLYIEKLDYLGAFKERIHYFQEWDYKKLQEMARVQYLHALIWEYSRAKDILKDKQMVRHIKKEYRKYYSIGTKNNQVENETKGYMLRFFLFPWVTDFFEKVKGKLSRG